MIARSWQARATRDGATAYLALFESLVPNLAAIDGHRGAMVFTADLGGERVEITVLTLWESMDAVARFAGPTPDRAVVEAEARAVLESFDERVVHRQVVLDVRLPTGRTSDTT